MTQPQQQRNALQVIFAFFLGLMVTAFIGIGVYTFYPPGTDEIDDRLEELRLEEQDLRFDGRPQLDLSEEQRARIKEIDAETRELGDRRRERQERWTRDSSVILVLLSTLVMAVSMVRADQLPVISNGLLLGGVFTMLYGTAWTLASGESQLRFWVMAFALLVTLGLGWMRFVRGQRARHQIAAAGPVADVSGLEARVGELERKLAAAGDAFRARAD